MSFKMVWSTDWHIADEAPQNRIDDYTETCFRKIGQIRSICEQHKADIALIGGDVFHVKSSSKVRHALVTRLIKEFASFPCPVYSIVGNHDISHNNIDTLPEKPLGVLFACGSLKRLDEEVFTKDGVSVRIIGKHFDPKVTHKEFDTIQKGIEDWLCVAYHGYASLNGVSYPGEVTFKYHTLAKLPVDDWFFGHWHIDQSVMTIQEKNFVNVGSLTRGSLTLENVTRVPKAVVCEYTKTERKMIQIKLQVEPAENVFDIQKKNRIDKEQETIHRFITSLRTNTLDKSPSLSIDDRVVSYHVDAHIKNKVMDLLAEAGLELHHAKSTKAI